MDIYGKCKRHIDVWLRNMALRLPLLHGHPICFPSVWIAWGFPTVRVCTYTPPLLSSCGGHGELVSAAHKRTLTKSGIDLSRVRPLPACATGTSGDASPFRAGKAISSGTDIPVCSGSGVLEGSCCSTDPWLSRLQIPVLQPLRSERQGITS